MRFMVLPLTFSIFYRNLLVGFFDAQSISGVTRIHSVILLRYVSYVEFLIVVCEKILLVRLQQFVILKRVEK